MSLKAPREMEVRHGGLTLNCMDDFSAWGSGVATAYFQMHLLCELSTSLSYYPLAVEDSLLAETAFWKREADGRVRKMLRDNKVEKPPYLEAFDLDVYAVADFGLTPTEKKTLDAARKKVYNAQAKAYAIKLEIYEDAYKVAVDDVLTILKSESRQKLWHLVVVSLGTEFSGAISMVKHGDVNALLHELSVALHSDPKEERARLKILLWSGNFEKDGECDLSKFKFFITKCAKRLDALGQKQSDEDLVTIFLKGLPSNPFAPFRTGLGKSKSSLSFLQIADEALAFANSDDIRVVLDQLRDSHQRVGSRKPEHVFGVKSKSFTNQQYKGECFDYQKGSCVRAESCRFSHSGAGDKAKPSVGKPPVFPPKGIVVSCGFCGKKGHIEAECRFKASGKQRQTGTRNPERKHVPLEKSDEARKMRVFALKVIEEYEEAKRLKEGGERTDEDEELTTELYNLTANSKKAAKLNVAIMPTSRGNKRRSPNGVGAVVDLRHSTRSSVPRTSAKRPRVTTSIFGITTRKNSIFSNKVAPTSTTQIILCYRYMTS